LTRRLHRAPCRLALVVLVSAALWPSGIARAAETRTVEVTAEVHGLGRTPEEARREALQRARDMAVAEVAGIRIAAQQLRLKTEDPGQVRDAFSYLVHTSTYGRIVREEISYRTSLVDDVPVYRATLRAEVVLEEGDRDPGFALELRARPDSHIFREGEPITLELTSSRDCYVTLLDIDPGGGIALLFPNAYDGDNRLSAGRPLVLPRPSRGVEIRARRGDEGAGTHERILAVATLDRVPFVLDESDEDEIVPAAAREDAITALNRWLLRIPADRRVEALWNYEVVE
jgi:hypothetical protein